MNWETLYCPNRHCSCYGLPFGQGLLVKDGSSHGQKQALCRACGQRIALTYATAYFGLKTDPELFELAVRALAEGNAIHATARIVQRDTGVDFSPGRAGIATEIRYAFGTILSHSKRRGPPDAMPQ
jgi:hypothetical protein